MRFALFCFSVFAASVAGVLGQSSPDSLPRFLVQPSDVTVQAGHTARLECQVSSLADNQVVAWMKEATFQTRGRALLSTDPEKLSRITVEDSQSGQHLRYNLFIHNVRAEDAGLYHCYVVEFREMSRRRWLRSRPARLIVVDNLRPSVRCVPPTRKQLSQAENRKQPAPVGCTVLTNQPGMTVKLQNSDGTVLLQKRTDSSEPYILRYSVDVPELRTGRMTCLIGFRDEGVQGGEATRSCSMGPFIAVPPRENRTTTTVNLLSGSEGHLFCLGNESLGYGTTLPERPSWEFSPHLPPSRYSMSPDGMKLTITRVTPQDGGLVVSCTVLFPGGGRHVVDMGVRVMRSKSSTDGGGPDLHLHEAAAGSRDLGASKPVIGQAAWSVLRSRVRSGRVKPSSGPGSALDNIHLSAGAGNLPQGTSAPTTLVPQDSNQDVVNATPTPSLPTKDVFSPSAVTPLTDQPPLTLSPLIIVALCEAGMSLVILVIAFAVLCQCCCRNKTKPKVRGDKDLTLATASFGKQSTTPTLLTYKSTSCPPAASDLSQKKLPPIPPEAVYTRPETIAGTKKVLREADLPPTGSWVFSSVNSESGEAESTATTTREAGNEIYVTMV